MSSSLRRMDAASVSAGSVVEVGAVDDRTGVSRWLDRVMVERALSVLSPVLLLAVWQIGTLVRKSDGMTLIDTRFFPAPTSILQVLGQMLQTGEILNHLGISLSRIAIGFCIGAIPGVIVGIAMGQFGPIRAVIQPLAVC